MNLLQTLLLATTLTYSPLQTTNDSLQQHIHTQQTHIQELKKEYLADSVLEIWEGKHLRKEYKKLNELQKIDTKYVQKDTTEQQILTSNPIYYAPSITNNLQQFYNERGEQFYVEPSKENNKIISLEILLGLLIGTGIYHYLKRREE